MLRLRSLSLRVVQRHTAASSSTSPWSTGQHWLAAGSPTPTWTNPPSRSTQAPSLRVSMGHVACAGDLGGGHGVFPPFPGVVGGLSTGGIIPGGFTMGGTVMGGTVTGGTVTGGLTMGGTEMGGRVTGGLTTGVFGFWACFGFLGGFPQ